MSRIMLDSVSGSALSSALLLISSSIALVQSQETFAAAGLIGSHFGIPYFNATFDYVVVGGGTAGLTVASRLAENASNSVAVIEAGSLYELDNGNLSTIPGYGAYWLGTAPTERNPLVDWEIYTEPMTVSHGALQLLGYLTDCVAHGCRGSTTVSFSIHRARP